MSIGARRGAAVLAVWVLAAGSALAQSTVVSPGPGAQAPAAFVPDAGAPFASFDGAWPARAGDAEGRGFGVIVPVNAKASTLGVKRSFMPGGAPSTATDKEHAAALEGALRDRAKGGAGVRCRVEGPNSVTFESVPGRRGGGIGIGPGRDAGSEAFAFVFVSGEEMAAGADGERAIGMQRTWFAWYDPRGAEGDGAQPGLRRAALVMPGMFGNPEPVVDRLVRRLRAEGFGVLRMLAPPSRFTEYAEFTVHPGDLKGDAAGIAGLLGNRAAECAYAAEAAWGHVEGQRPAVKEASKIVIGMSGGAISLPIVYARRPDRYGAAVIIAGGADYWLINERSSYRSHVAAMRTVWPEGATAEQRAELDRLYLAASPLDSFHTGAALRGKRVLVLQGLVDTAVPSALGDVLWERLGRPERWTYPVGHEMLFANLPQEFDRLLTWIDAGVPGQGERP